MCDKALRFVGVRIEGVLRGNLSLGGLFMKLWCYSRDEIFESDAIGTNTR